MEIGKNLIRVDAEAKVTGEALYPGDINFENQLYMKTLFSEKPHAIIKKIDTSAAEKLPGVILVLTAKDVPNNEYGLGIQDHGPGLHENGQRCRRRGSPSAGPGLLRGMSPPGQFLVDSQRA